MKEEDTTRSDNNSSTLSDAEQLLRHQLNVLHYWHTRAENSRRSRAEQVLDDALPEVWSLHDGLTLHDWQVECRDRWLQSGGKGVIKVVTGAGKTIVALAAAQAIQNSQDRELRIAIVVPTIVLMDQWHDMLFRFSNLPTSAIGRMGGGYDGEFSEECRIMICVLASAAKSLSKQVDTKVGAHLMLIVDECHRAGAEHMSKIFQAKRRYSLGLSATPEREDVRLVEEEDEYLAREFSEKEETFEDTVIGQELGSIVYELSFDEALRRGILPKFEIRHYGLPLSQEERANYDKISKEISDLRESLQEGAGGLEGGILVGWARKIAKKPTARMAIKASQFIDRIAKRKQLLYHAKAREQAVIKILKDQIDANKEAKAILFHESIDEVMRLFSALKKNGYGVVPENSKLPDKLREESVEAFRQGRAQVMVSARSLIEGFDVPAADIGIVVASSSSVRQRIQTLGRILRKYQSQGGEEKYAVLHVLYMADTVDELIYEKNDWAAFIGAERNVYHLWDPEKGLPILQQGPPRSPLPKETDIDWDKIESGVDYPGEYEGNEYTCDTRGNVFGADKKPITNPQDIAALVMNIKNAAGKFKVTPKRRAVLVIVHEGGAWKTKFVGFLKESFKYAESIDVGEPAPDVSALQPGDEYPIYSEKDPQYKLKRKAHGHLIAKTIRGGQLFARVSTNATDAESGADAERIIAAAMTVARRDNIWIPSFWINQYNHAVYLSGGKPRYLCKLTKGLEF